MSTIDPERAAAMQQATAPTVPGLPLFGHAATFVSANGIPVEFLQRAQREQGDLVHFKVMNQSFYLVADPDLVREMLLERVTEFLKPEAIAVKPHGLSRFLGHGILTADYEEWRPQRKLLQPLMHTARIAQYADTMGSMGERLLTRWQDGAVRDIHADMTQVTMWIIAETMFGITVDQNAELETAGRSAQKIVVADLVSPLPAWLTGRDAEAERINALLTELVRRFVDEHRAENRPARHDLLSLLLETRDEAGRPLSDEFLRDNILTMFFAGHETTANTLTWAFYHLAQHPEILERLQQEVDAVISPERWPTLADLPQLPYTLMVIKETMRIQPTVATFPRVINRDTALGGYRLKAGSVILISPYVLHHDPRRWSAPDVFDPTHFSADNEPAIPKYAYLPFGGGPRICIGNHFALMEAHILLALIVRHYHLHLVPGTKIKPLYQVTSFPQNGLPMRLERRA